MWHVTKVSTSLWSWPTAADDIGHSREGAQVQEAPKGTTQPVGSVREFEPLAIPVAALLEAIFLGAQSYLRPKHSPNLDQFAQSAFILVQVKGNFWDGKKPRNPHPDHNPRKRHRAHWIEDADQKYLGPALVESKAELKHIVSDWHGSPTIGRWPMPYN